MLDQRGQALDPVAVVGIGQAVDHPQLGMVDVAADHAVDAAPARLADHRQLEVVDEADRTLDLELQVARERPVGQPQARAGRVQHPVEPQRQLVEAVADMRQPARALDHAVEQVAVHHPEPAAVGGLVDAVLHHLDAAEGMAGIAARELVMVAGHEDHPRALARLAQHLLHHVVVRLRPEPAPLQLPAVDDVPDQIERLALDRAQEVEQRLGLAAGRAQVHVGNEHGADRQRLLREGTVRRRGGGGGDGVHGAIVGTRDDRPVKRG